jgi:hypothetical protein
MTRLTRTLALAAGLALAAALAAVPGAAAAQQILLDRPVRAGELTVFPDLNDASVYYYVSDKPRLATDANGRPQFSFLRWVQNTRSGADQPDAREGEGGGIVHAVVELGVTQDQLRQAQQELQRVRPGARIQGPVVYKSGRFGLVAAVADPTTGLSQKVLGLGKAPILDGEKAAVSILLTKQGAKILWESFNTPTPDVSFTFEMDMAGFRSPMKGVIEANFDQIYEHRAFSVGVASSYLSGEIRGAFDDLTRSGAIKVTQVGADEKIENLLNVAYQKLTDMMFAPVGGTGTPSLGALEGATGNQPSMLDRATQQLQRSREETRAENERIRRENREEEERAEARRRERAAAGGGTTTTAVAGETAGGPPDSRTAGGGGGGAASDESPPTPVTGRSRVTPPADRGHGAASRLAGDPDPDRPRRREEQTEPTFAVVAAFEMRTVRQRGTFRIDLNKFNADNITLRFDENIGDLRALKNDRTHFREVNLEDALYVQREIPVSVDGFNAQDFGQFVNFVAVHLRKKHAGGAVTDDEVKIDRKTFNSEGNAFKLLYGWKGDNDRRKWLEYDVSTTWSFFGGHEVTTPARTVTQGQLNLSPPFQRRTVELQGDPGALSAAGARAVTVKLWYRLGAREQVKQVTLNPARGQLSDRIEFLLPADSWSYDYEITWRLAGNRTASTGRRAGQDAILFVDELPTSP